MSRVRVHSFDTAWGTFRVAATERGLILISLPNEAEAAFAKHLARLTDHADTVPGGEVNLRAQQQIEQYLAGERRSFDLPLDLTGTPFQRRALAQVAAIPYGRTRTYGEIARALGQPKAARAVGSANARNKLPLVIPCHRVVATVGLGGYGGGLDLKKKLLALESAG